jgi:undecaprenyl-diphosphatase
MISIRFFLKLIDKVKLVPFAIYRIVLALVIFIVYF